MESNDSVCFQMKMESRAAIYRQAQKMFSMEIIVGEGEGKSLRMDYRSIRNLLFFLQLEQKCEQLTSSAVLTTCLFPQGHDKMPDCFAVGAGKKEENI